jgi:NADH:ubiquinone oxidoreductase 24 kD subunit
MTDLFVCIGSSCHLKGSYNVIQTFQQLIEEQRLHERVNLKATFCIKKCDNDGIGVLFEDKHYNVKPENIKTFFNDIVIPII